MKKTLLLAAAMVATISASAQEKAYFASSISGLTTSKAAVTGGTACGSTSLVDATIGADDDYKLVSINGPKDANDNSYKKITIDGVSLSESEPGLEQGGIQGNGNPKDIDGGTPSSTLKAPASGAFFQFKAKGDGYLYVVAKMSSNKSYTVFEEGSALPYQFAQATTGSSIPNPLTYDLTGTGTASEGAEYITLADHPYGINWPEQIAAGLTTDTVTTVAIGKNAVGTFKSAWAKIGENGVGILAFPIFKDLTYQVNANGSKMSGLGFYTSTAKAQSIVLNTDDDSATPIVFVENGNLVGGTVTDGINKVSADKQGLNAMDARYNLAGQRVSGAYKGVIIQNGKKFIVK